MYTNVSVCGCLTHDWCWCWCFHGQVMEAAGDTDRALLVKFVTSCQRPPSLGFGALNPPFCIQV